MIVTDLAEELLGWKRDVDLTHKQPATASADAGGEEEPDGEAGRRAWKACVQG